MIDELTRSRLDLTRSQILAFRRHVGALDERLPRGARSLRRAAWAGLQDSMPRAALLSIHARVDGTHPSSWEDPSLVQVWGPRFSTYVVPARDRAVFTLGRLPDDARGARLELARRYLHVFGPTTPESFAQWAGIGLQQGIEAFEALRGTLTPVRSPIGDAWILTRDEPAFRAPEGPAAPARLLPSGDAYFLLQGADRELLVADAERRSALWTSRVWPGAVLVEGEIVGTWRRAERTMMVQPWERLSRTARDAVQAEAEALPLPG